MIASRAQKLVPTGTSGEKPRAGIGPDKEFALSNDKWVIEIDASEREGVTDIVMALASDADFLSAFRASPHEAVANRGVKVSDTVIDKLEEQLALLTEEIGTMVVCHFILVVVQP